MTRKGWKLLCSKRRRQKIVAKTVTEKTRWTWLKRPTRTALLEDLKIEFYKSTRIEVQRFSEEENWNTNKMDIKMKFLCCSIIAALEKPVLFHFFLLCKENIHTEWSLNAELHNINNFSSTSENGYVTTDSRWSRRSVSQIHQHTHSPAWAMGAEVSLPEMWYSRSSQ